MSMLGKVIRQYEECINLITPSTFHVRNDAPKSTRTHILPTLCGWRPLLLLLGKYSGNVSLTNWNMFSMYREHGGKIGNYISLPIYLLLIRLLLLLLLPPLPLSWYVCLALLVVLFELAAYRREINCNSL